MTRLLVLLLGVSLTAGAADFNASARKLQPPPSGHVPGKDNGKGDGLHNAGEDCGICHTPGGRAPEQLFTMSGTLYEDRAGRRPLAGAEVILQDIAGNVVSMTTNVVGNFWTYAAIASNPRAIASHSGQTHLLYSYQNGQLVPADPADTRTWQYKGWVKSGDQVIPMVTLAPVGGATSPTSRMSCNMHHSPFGSSGALWVSRRPALQSYPPEQLSFRRHVRPILVSKCAPCHIPGARPTRLVTESDVDAVKPTGLDYSGGHDFTAWAGSTYEVGGVPVAKKGVKDAVDTVNPELSPLLAKTRVRPHDAELVHPGGGFFAPEDADYKALSKWIAEGAQDN